MKKNRTAYFNYRKETFYQRIIIYFNKEKDKDIIEKLKRCKSKPEYLRKLIRDDLKNENQNKEK